MPPTGADPPPDGRAPVVPMDVPSSEATRLLRAVRAGEATPDDITSRLVALMYPDLRALAGRLMQAERRDHTLQPTAVVNEVFVRLVDQAAIDWQDRAHFVGIAARVMRQILVDHARRRHAAKRGAAGERITLDDAMIAAPDTAFELLALDEVLTRFAALDARRARVAELRVFGGLTSKEIATHLGVSTRTVEGDWAVARLWLARELRPGTADAGA
jgi:RNA polymerase sigma-70 factor, ECF subfamily